MMKKEKVLIAGGSGLVGNFLAHYLVDQSYEVSIVSRTKRQHEKFNYFTWDLKAQKIEEAALEVDHVINLTGAGIAESRWTDKRKKVIIDSRTQSNKLLYTSIRNQSIRPKTFTSASAVGIYGNRADEVLDENAEIGDPKSFMVECCQLWEAEALKMKELVSQVSLLRIGIVLSTKGGALSKFMLPLKLGQANYLGDGQQYYSSIHIEDLARVFHFILQEKVDGIINGVSPQASTNKDFMKACKKAFAPYALLYPVPAFAMKLAMGEMAAVVLNSNRVIPKKLKSKGFEFSHPTLENALMDLKKRKI